MTWTKLDDNVYDRPTMVRAGEDAADLYVRGLVYCNKHLTDGRLEAEVLHVLTRRSNAEQSAAALVRVGEWIVHPDGGWTVRAFHEHNPAAEVVIAKRAELSAKRANAGKTGGKRSGEARSNEAKPKQDASTDRSKPEASDPPPSKQTASNTSDGVEAPSRPVPSSSSSEEGVARAREDHPEASKASPNGPVGDDLPTPGDLVQAFREGAYGVASVGADAQALVKLGEALVDLDVTEDEARAMGAALGNPSAWWPRGSEAPRNVTLRALRGFYNPETKTHDWGPVQELAAHIRAEAKRRAQREADERKVAEMRRPSPVGVPPSDEPLPVADFAELMKQVAREKAVSRG